MAAKSLPSASRTRPRRGVVGESIREALSEHKTALVEGVRERIFNAGIVGSIMRKTWEKSQAQDGSSDVAQQTFGAIQHITMNTQQTNVILLRIEKIITNISDNVYNIAGAMRAQVTSMRETATMMSAGSEEQADETPYAFRKNDRTGAVPVTGKAQDQQQQGWMGRIFDNLMSILKPLALIEMLIKSVSSLGSMITTFMKVLGPAALVISSAYAGFKFGEWLNKKFGISNKIVDLLSSGDDKRVQNMLQGKPDDAPEVGNAFGEENIGEQWGPNSDYQKSKQGPEKVSTPPTAGAPPVTATPAAAEPMKKETPTGDEGKNDEDKKRLLDYIADKEAGTYGYNSLVYGAKGKDVPKAAPLTDMTLEQVLNYQKGMIKKGHASTALGRYQFTNKTLQELIQKAGLSMSTKFSAQIQDKLAGMLIDKAGWKEYTSGKMRIDEFQNKLAGVWASLPKDDGRSAYEGIAGNKVGAKSGAFQGVLSSMAGLNKPSPPEQVASSANSGEVVGQTTTAVNTMRDDRSSQPIVVAAGGGGSQSDGGMNTQRSRGIPSPVASRGSLEEAVSLVGAA